MAEKRLQYLAEEINSILDRSVIFLETEAERELMASTIKRAGGIGRYVYVSESKKFYKYNIDQDIWSLVD